MQADLPLIEEDDLVEHRLDVRLDARAWREARTLAELTELTLRELAESPSR